MKTAFLGLLLVIIGIGMLLFVCSAFAEQEERVEVNQYGEIRVSEQGQVIWRPLTSEERVAYNNPGVEVPINLGRTMSERRLWKSFFHRTPFKKYSNAVVFSNGELKTIEKQGKQYGEQKFTLYVILLLVAIIFMAILNIIIWKVDDKKNTFFVVVGITSYIVAIVAVLVAAVIVVSVVVTVAVLVAFVAIIAAAGFVINATVYKISIIVFYICTIVAMLV